MKRRFDIAIGRVTIYRLALYSLAIIALIAFGFSFTDLLFYKPLELLPSAAVALGVSWGSNVLLARAFRVSANVESSLISGLLLFFLFWPGYTFDRLLPIALAAVAASATKYLLVVRGRHIFNPAAAGAVIVGLTGLGASVWWVASTPLFIPVLIGAFLLLYRLRRLAMAVVFTVVSVGVTALILISRGMDAGGAFSTPFLSYPIVFLAGFMLSEPLTTPPRRWHQVSLAVLVGLLFSIPWTIGPVFSTPELALVVGNLFAFLVGQRRGIRLQLLQRRKLTPTVTELTFVSPRRVRFQAGQYLELDVPHAAADARGRRRMFSISSPPSTPHTLSIAYRADDRGGSAAISSFKRALAEIEPGERVRATGVWGDFVLPVDARRPVLMIAAGIGITPFVSQLAHLKARAEEHDNILLYIASEPDELAYADELAASDAEVLIVSRSEPEHMPDGWSYVGWGRMTRERLQSIVPDLEERIIYVSGPPGLVDSLRRELPGRVRSDYFSGY